MLGFWWMTGFCLNEAPKQQVKERMAEQKSQPRRTLEEALAQYDKICWRQKLGIDLRGSWAWRVNQLMSKLGRRTDDSR